MQHAAGAREHHHPFRPQSEPSAPDRNDALTAREETAIPAIYGWRALRRYGAILHDPGRSSGWRALLDARGGEPVSGPRIHNVE